MELGWSREFPFGKKFPPGKQDYVFTRFVYLRNLNWIDLFSCLSPCMVTRCEVATFLKQKEIGAKTTLLTINAYMKR